MSTASSAKAASVPRPQDRRLRAPASRAAAPARPASRSAPTSTRVAVCSCRPPRASKTTATTKAARATVVGVPLATARRLSARARSRARDGRGRASAEAACADTRPREAAAAGEHGDGDGDEQDQQRGGQVVAAVLGARACTSAPARSTPRWPPAVASARPWRSCGVAVASGSTRPPAPPPAEPPPLPPEPPAGPEPEPPDLPRPAAAQLRPAQEVAAVRVLVEVGGQAGERLLVLALRVGAVDDAVVLAVVVQARRRRALGGDGDDQGAGEREDGWQAAAHGDPALSGRRG